VEEGLFLITCTVVGEGCLFVCIFGLEKNRLRSNAIVISKLQRLRPRVVISDFRKNGELILSSCSKSCRILVELIHDYRYVLESVDGA
jgi:hypothetical protein